MPGDWREWLNGARTDLNSGLEALDKSPKSRLLVDWATAYGPKLIEKVREATELVHLARNSIRVPPPEDPMAGRSMADAIVSKMDRFLRGVGRG